MPGDISVCHVVNRLQDTTMAGDLAVAQESSGAFDKVGILAWFEIDSYEKMSPIETVSLGVPDTLSITRSQYMKAKSVLSEYDVIHTHHPHSGFYAKLIAKRLNKPTVQTEHNNHGGFTRKGQIANGITNILADSVVCVSESVRESFSFWEDLIVAKEKVDIINNGVNIDQVDAARKLKWSIHDEVEIDPDSIIVGSAGMLTRQKAHEILIRAVDQANVESDQPIELVISGDGELRRQIEQQISEAKHTDRLHLLGFLDTREQVYKMMHEIDIYSMPSRWEGFCVAALEAMAIGNECVFSDIDEFKKPFEGVARFHITDDSEDLCRQILSAIREEDTQMAQKGRNLILDRYTMEHTVESYLQKYREVYQ